MVNLKHNFTADTAPIARTLGGAFKLKLRDFTAYARVVKVGGCEQYFIKGDTGPGYDFEMYADEATRTGWATREDAEVAVTMWMAQLWADHAHPVEG